MKEDLEKLREDMQGARDCLKKKVEIIIKAHNDELKRKALAIPLLDRLWRRMLYQVLKANLLRRNCFHPPLLSSRRFHQLL